MENNPTFYVASKTAHAAKWRELRKTHRINSTWIDEAGEGESASYEDLAARCIQEVTSADILVLYCEPHDLLKGALIEVGAALAANIPIRCVGDCPSISRIFRKHKLWKEYPSLESAFNP